MIGLDTSLLVRYLVGDDKRQSEAADKLVSNGDLFFINLIVLCELVWVLESCYDLKKESLVDVLEKILATRQFVVEKSDLVWRALDDFKGTKADFSDCLIGRANRDQDCRYTASFDKGTKNLETFQFVAL